MQVISGHGVHEAGSRVFYDHLAKLAVFTAIGGMVVNDTASITMPVVMMGGPVNVASILFIITMAFPIIITSMTPIIVAVTTSTASSSVTVIDSRASLGSAVCVDK